MTKPIEETSPRRGQRVAVVGCVAALAVAGLAACSDDDEPSAQEQYCAAGESLRSSLDSLFNTDVLAEGTNGVGSAVDQVVDDVNQLKETASGAAAEEVDALESSVDDLEDSLSAVSGELTAENATAVIDAISAVVEAATAVYDTLSEC